MSKWRRLTEPPKRKWKMGDAVSIDYGKDPDGKWWWRCELDGHFHYGGPADSEAECRRHSEEMMLGPQCKTEFGGMWDPAWNIKQ